MTMGFSSCLWPSLLQLRRTAAPILPCCCVAYICERIPTTVLLVLTVASMLTCVSVLAGDRAGHSYCRRVRHFHARGCCFCAKYRLWRYPCWRVTGEDRRSCCSCESTAELKSWLASQAYSCSIASAGCSQLASDMTEHIWELILLYMRA